VLGFAGHGRIGGRRKAGIKAGGRDYQHQHQTIKSNSELA
jgi:hypothetical protein